MSTRTVVAWSLSMSTAEDGMLRAEPMSERRFDSKRALRLLLVRSTVPGGKLNVAWSMDGAVGVPPDGGGGGGEPDEAVAHLRPKETSSGRFCSVKRWHWLQKGMKTAAQAALQSEGTPPSQWELPEQHCEFIAWLCAISIASPAQAGRRQ